MRPRGIKFNGLGRYSLLILLVAFAIVCLHQYAGLPGKICSGKDLGRPVQGDCAVSSDVAPTNGFDPDAYLLAVDKGQPAPPEEDGEASATPQHGRIYDSSEFMPEPPTSFEVNGYLKKIGCDARMAVILTFKDADGGTYSVPEAELPEFQKALPGARPVQPYRDADGNVFDIAEEDVADFMAASPGAKPDLKLRMPNDEKIVVPIDEVYNFLNAYKSDPDAAIERYLSKVEKFRKAAEQGNALAQYNLGCCYLSGEGVKEDLVQAVAWFRKAAEQGNALAQSLLMIYYRDGTGGVKKYSAEAVAWYHKAAEQGYADAQYLLGQCYANGEGVKKDPVQAVAWYRKAAEQGDADAQDMLGQCYANGEGVKKDPVQAVAWYRKAAERRDVYAQASFRFQHYMAEQGDASAQYLLGQCYANGNGVKTNLVQAAAWYRKAADQGDPGAQGRLGQCYDYGDGVTANPVQAATWYQKAAEQGYAYAQYRLGLCYEKGRGVVQNDIQACVHHLIASALGFDESSRNLKGLLDDRLSAKDYAAAQRVATEWMERFHARAKKGAPQTPESMTARRGDKPRGTGSGFVISMDGYFLTCAHVIEGGREIKVRIGDKTHPAKVVRADNRNDVALLKLEGSDFRPLSLSQSPPDMGDKVFTVGFPNPEIQGASAKYTDGAISALSGILDDIRTMQVTVPIQGGNSGGALADAAGNVVGLVVAQLNAVTVFEYTGAIPQNVNFAVKINYAFPLIQAVPGLSSRLPQQAKAGASASPVKAVEAATGLVVVYE